MSLTTGLFISPSGHRSTRMPPVWVLCQSAKASGRQEVPARHKRLFTVGSGVNSGGEAQSPILLLPSSRQARLPKSPTVFL